MNVRLPFVLFVVSVTVALTPLAYADLPDQVWLEGFYDGGDDDHAVSHVQSYLEAIEASQIRVEAILAPCVFPCPQPHDTSHPVRISSSDHTRAPPAS